MWMSLQFSLKAVHCVWEDDFDRLKIQGESFVSFPIDIFTGSLVCKKSPFWCLIPFLLKCFWKKFRVFLFYTPFLCLCVHICFGHKICSPNKQEDLSNDKFILHFVAKTLTSSMFQSERLNKNYFIEKHRQVYLSMYFKTPNKTAATLWHSLNWFCFK